MSENNESNKDIPDKRSDSSNKDPVERSIKIFPIAIAVLTVVAYGIGAIESSVEAQDLKLLLLTPESNRYSLQGGLLLALLFTAIGFLIWLDYGLEVGAAEKIINKINALTYKQEQESQEARRKRRAFWVGLAFMLVSAAMFTGTFLGKVNAKRGVFSVVTVSSSAITNSGDQEYLVLGADDKQFAMLTKPNTLKKETAGTLIYVPRSEVKTMSLKSLKTVKEFTKDWNPKFFEEGK